MNTEPSVQYAVMFEGFQGMPQLGPNDGTHSDGRMLHFCQTEKISIPFPFKLNEI